MRGPIPDKPRERPSVPTAIALAREYYQQLGNSVGGHLHIVLDDDNIDDHHIAWCQEQAREAGDVAGEHLASLLLQMTRTQRRKVCGANLYQI